jgi:glycosyltransferase involved in cell wall biosynthesis
MKIGLIIEGTYPWYMGGVSEWIHQYVTHMKQHDFYILQIATDDFRRMELKHGAYKLAPNILQFHRIPVPPLQIISSKVFHSWYQEWVHIFKEFDVVDLFHATNTGFAGLIGAYLKSVFRKPLLLTEHAIYWKEVELGTRALECGYTIPESREQVQFYVNYFQRTAQRIYKTADRVVSVSKYNLPLQGKFGASQIQYIPNGVHEKFIVTGFEKKNNIPVIGWVGRCSDLKNPIRFFDILAEFQAKKFPVRGLMLLAQSGESALEQKVIEASRYFQHVELIWNQKSERFFDEMDFLCLTSKHESQPLVLFEAIARGVIPVGWEVGDATGEYGIFLPPTSSAEFLVKKMIGIWKNPKKKKELIHSLQTKIVRQHQWEQIFGQYEQVLWQLTEQQIKVPKPL